METPFPPAGWVTNHEAARILGITVKGLSDRVWRPLLRDVARNVPRPPKGQCNIYLRAGVERARQARADALAARAAADARGPEIPDGFVDRDGARRIFGVTVRQWKHWITDGKVTCGVIIPKRLGGKCSVYSIEALKKLREQLYARDVLYNYARDNYVTPTGWARPHDLRKVFGVNVATWNQWQSGGVLSRAERFDGGPVMHNIEELKQSLQRAGKLAAPYPDPVLSGAQRVPLCDDAEGREAIVDADALHLLDGAVLKWGSNHSAGEGRYVSLFTPQKLGGVPLRRLVLSIADEGRQVGHRNGDPLDCRRVNLLARTIQQRNFGMRKMRSIKGQPCTSQFKGVCLESQTKKWRASIGVDGKTRRLGRFRDEIAAAQAYDEAARELFGEHARLNFPHGVDAWLEAQAQRLEQAERAQAA
jgi:hypothetical protein